MTTLTLNSEFNRLAPEEQVTKTVHALEANGLRTLVVDTGEQARASVWEMIPAGVQVYNPPSRTLDQIGLAANIETSTRFQPLRARLRALDRATQQHEIRQLIGSPDVVVGSVRPYLFSIAYRMLGSVMDAEDGVLIVMTIEAEASRVKTVRS